VANLPAPAVPPGFLPRATTTAAPPPVPIGPPTHAWPTSPVTYIRREVGAGAARTRGAPGAALSREVGTGATGTRGAPKPAPRPELGAGAAGTRGAPGAALRREVGAGAAGARGTPGATLRREVGAGAAPEAALSRAEGVAASGHVALPKLPCAERWVPEPR
jgi:hypothetical protein